MKNKREIFELIIIIILFIIASYFVQTNAEFFEKYLEKNFFGFLTYIIIIILSIVIAPLSSLPLALVVAVTWGPLIAFVTTITGWVIGSLIAFIISRRYGVPLIKKFISLKKIHKIEKLISQREKFWNLILLRMIIPVDILSYALGLFSNVGIKTFTITTIIGVAPFLTLYVFMGNMKIYNQVIMFLLIIIVIMVIILIDRIRSKKKVQ